MSEPIISITLWRDEATAAIQLDINERDEKGGGHGFRIFGPKFSGNSTQLVNKRLSKSDAQRIREYLDKVTSDES